MKQAELIEAIKQIPGYQSMYHRAEDFRDKDQDRKPINGTGRQQIYTVWQRVNGVLKNHRVDILVLGMGTPKETAEPFVPLSQYEPAQATFLNEVMAELPAYQAANLAIQRIILTKCDEINQLAFLTSYELQIGLGVINEVSKIAYKDGDIIAIKNYNPIARPGI